jgi:hypothetical protein
MEFGHYAEVPNAATEIIGTRTASGDVKAVAQSEEI